MYIRSWDPAEVSLNCHLSHERFKSSLPKLCGFILDPEIYKMLVRENGGVLIDISITHHQVLVT